MSANPSLEVLRARWWRLRLHVQCWRLRFSFWRLARAGKRAARAFAAYGVTIPPEKDV